MACMRLELASWLTAEDKKTRSLPRPWTSTYVRTWPAVLVWKSGAARTGYSTPRYSQLKKCNGKHASWFTAEEDTIRGGRGLLSSSSTSGKVEPLVVANSTPTSHPSSPSDHHPRALMANWRWRKGSSSALTNARIGVVLSGALRMSWASLAARIANSGSMQTWRPQATGPHTRSLGTGSYSRHL